MEQFFLNFIATFRRSWDGIYTTCKEFQAGLFQFNDFRPLPCEIVERLGLEEFQDYDDEANRWVYWYSPNFNA